MDSSEEKILGYLPVGIYKAFMNMNPAIVQKTCSQELSERYSLTLRLLMASASWLPMEVYNIAVLLTM